MHVEKVKKKVSYAKEGNGEKQKEEGDHLVPEQLQCLTVELVFVICYPPIPVAYFEKVWSLSWQ